MIRWFKEIMPVAFLLWFLWILTGKEQDDWAEEL
jgi:hypothetical protein